MVILIVRLKVGLEHLNQQNGVILNKLSKPIVPQIMLKEKRFLISKAIPIG